MMARVRCGNRPKYDRIEFNVTMAEFLHEGRGFQAVASGEESRCNEMLHGILKPRESPRCSLKSGALEMERRRVRDGTRRCRILIFWRRTPQCLSSTAQQIGVQYVINQIPQNNAE
jgi:hypothetical protein